MSLSQKSRENYTRVTTVLFPFSGLQHIDPVVLENAGRRGTKVHEICEAIAAGLGEFGTDEETQPYVDSFKIWWETGIKVISMEERFWDDELEITGQCDFIIEDERGMGIIDLKTSSKPSKTWEAQGNAYAMMAIAKGYPIKFIQFVHLSKTGKPPKIIEYPVRIPFFLAILTTYKHFFHKATHDNT